MACPPSAMPTPVQSMYVVDPDSHRLRMAIEVDPDGWLDEEIEPMLANLVRTLAAQGARMGLAVSVDSSFVLRTGGAQAPYEIDEIGTSELLSPHPLHPAPDRLLDAVRRWLEEMGKQEQAFLAMAMMPRRAPEIVGLAKNARITVRQGGVEPEAGGF